MSKINEVAELVEKGKAKLVGPAVQEAIDEGDDPVAILNDGMISAMSVVGDKFKNGEIFVPEMLVAARAMKKGVEVLKPHLASGSTGALGKVIIATVSGDLHDIGKNLAPITEAFAEEIGADGYSDDAASAASLAKKLAAA